MVPLTESRKCRTVTRDPGAHSRNSFVRRIVRECLSSRRRPPDAAETGWQTFEQASATLQAEATTTASASERTGWRIYGRSKPTLKHECMQTLLIAGEKSVLSWPVLANLAPNTAGPRRCRASFCVDRESKLLVARVTWAARRMTF